MKNFCHGQVTGIPMDSSKTFTEEELETILVSEFEKVNTIQNSGSSWMKRISKKTDSLAQGLLDHATLGKNISETVKGKLNLSKKLLRSGSFERVFTKSFDMEKEERLLKAYQCYLSTTTGPIAGVLFISTKKIAFRSDISLSLTSPKGELIKVPYKVSIPLEKIQCLTPSENMNKPEQKYMQIVTIDGFEFWFIGFISFQRSFNYLEQVILDIQ